MLMGTSNGSSTAVDYARLFPTTKTTVDDIICISQPVVIDTYSYTMQSLVKDIKIKKLTCENCGGAIDKDSMCCKFCGSAYMIKEIYQ